MTNSIKYLGHADVVGSDEARSWEAACTRVGIDPSGLSALSWHCGDQIKQARADGRVVAEFRVRAHDPVCVVVRPG